MFFKYKIKYFNDFEEKQKTVRGLVFAPTYALAIGKIVECYGEEPTAYITIEAMERNCPVYEMSEKEAE